jgi:hypothetical protein
MSGLPESGHDWTIYKYTPNPPLVPTLQLLGGSSIGWDPVTPGVNEFARLSSVAQVMIRTRLPMALSSNPTPG